MERLLIIDDDVEFLKVVESLLADRFHVQTATTGQRGLEILRSESVHAVLLDLRLPDADGVELLQTIHSEIDSHLPVIIVSEYGEPDRIVDSMRLGAYDFIPKSFHGDVLTAKLVKALERRSLELNVHALQSNLADQYDRMVFASDSMKRIHFEISRLAKLPFDVLLLGETGVGKDLVAFELHQRSPRHGKPFIPIAVRTLNEALIESELFGHEKGAFSSAGKMRIGKLEAANGGTVYLPEISCLTESVQLKLLQFLQYKSISRVGQDSRTPDRHLDVRVIMASNEDLEDHIQSGRIRKDFYHRVSGVKMTIPPLRERLDDIEVLTRYFLKKYSSVLSGPPPSLAPEAIEALRTYRWPGNVRELENTVKSALVSSQKDILTIRDFPQLAPTTREPARCSYCLEQQERIPKLDEAEGTFRRSYLLELLRRAGGSTTKAAAAAGITVQGFRKAMKGVKINSAGR
jgi:two-component system, NtrC family, response regulator